MNCVDSHLSENSTTIQRILHTKFKQVQRGTTTESAALWETYSHTPWWPRAEPLHLPWHSQWETILFKTQWFFQDQEPSWVQVKSGSSEFLPHKPSLSLAFSVFILNLQFWRGGCFFPSLAVSSLASLPPSSDALSSESSANQVLL